MELPSFKKTNKQTTSSRGSTSIDQLAIPSYECDSRAKLPFNKFRECFPMIDTCYLAPFMEALSAGLETKDNNTSFQLDLVSRGFETTIREAWINTLSGIPCYIFYDGLEDKYRIVLESELDYDDESDSNFNYRVLVKSGAKFMELTIPTPIKEQIMIYDHQVATAQKMGETGSFLFMKFESDVNQQSSRGAIESFVKKEKEALKGRTTNNIITTVGGELGAVAQSTECLAFAMDKTAKTIGGISGVPLSLLIQEETGGSTLAGGDSQALRSYKALVRYYQRNYLFPVYTNLLRGMYTDFTMIDPFSATEQDVVALEKAKLENYKLTAETLQILISIPDPSGVKSIIDLLEKNLLV